MNNKYINARIVVNNFFTDLKNQNFPFVTLALAFLFHNIFLKIWESFFILTKIIYAIKNYNLNDYKKCSSHFIDVVFYLFISYLFYFFNLEENTLLSDYFKIGLLYDLSKNSNYFNYLVYASRAMLDAMTQCQSAQTVVVSWYGAK